MKKLLIVIGLFISIVSFSQYSYLRQNGAIIRFGNSITVMKTPLPNYLIDKFALWVDFSNSRDDYYIDKVGIQEREFITENSVSGVVYPGRAINYDGSKSQQSKTPDDMPDNFRLANNSLSIFFRFRMDAAPTTADSYVFGTPASIINGAYFCAIDQNTGIMKFSVRHSTAAVSKTGVEDICDGEWHDIFILIDKAGNLGMYIDNVLQNGVTDISTYSFADYAEPFYMGGYPGFYSGIKYLRDMRLWSKAISDDATRDSIYNNQYVSDVTSWWLCESGNEDIDNPITDIISSNNLMNTNFDAISTAKGSWQSNLNRYGYSNLEYNGGDLILGDGSFSDAGLWSSGSVLRFAVEDGVAYFKNFDANDGYLNCDRVISYSNNETYKISFDVVEGTATMYFQDGLFRTIKTEDTYALGHHDIYFVPIYGGTKIAIYGKNTTGAFKIDNFTFEKYYNGIVPPKIDKQIPSTDIFDRLLTFKGQSKYNPLKITDGITLSDSIGELFEIAEDITINDWYALTGVGNNTLFSNIGYETGKQYYGNNEFILIKKGETITEYEDNLLKNRLGINDLATYSVNVSIGETSGTTSEIYATSRAILDQNDVSNYETFIPIDSDLDPTKKYIAIGWDDFFISDQLYTMPLNAKYNISSTFFRQIVPNTDDYRNTTKYPRDLLKMIEQSGNWIGDHNFDHISYISAQPTYDGRLRPSKDDLRIARSDGTNELGHDINSTVDASITTSIREFWLRLSSTIGTKAWKDLTDSECLSYTKSLGVFGMPVDGQNGEKVLEALDYLSNRYCGTSGYSVLNGDYDTRTPNTIGGVDPDVTHKIQGGIFQGAYTTENHEAWERIMNISIMYNEEFEGKIKPMYSLAVAGGNSTELYYNIENPPDAYGRYTDTAHTKIACGSSEYTSTITDSTRSFIDVLDNYGYIATNVGQGEGYSTYTFDKLQRLEAQRIFKKNGLKKPSIVGDGFQNVMRCWDESIPESDINSLFDSSDIVRALYDYTNDNARYSSLTDETQPSDFHDVLNSISKYTAWGLCRDFINDSYSSTDAGMASYVLALEALYQYCQRAGIEIISYAEAALMSINNPLPTNYNYWPNYIFETTIKDITGSINAPIYADGWDGGIVDGSDTSLYFGEDGTIFIRQYAIKPGTYNYSFEAKGDAYFYVRKIINNDTLTNISGVNFDKINDVHLVSPSTYTEFTGQIIIPDVPLETYAEPTTPQEEAYQNYMKGYGNKICGIQIEIVVIGGGEINIKNPVIQII